MKETDFDPIDPAFSLVPEEEDRRAAGASSVAGICGNAKNIETSITQ